MSLTATPFPGSDPPKAALPNVKTPPSAPTSQ
jgi:hypothetical protein